MKNYKARDKKLEKRKNKMKMHGKSLSIIYENAINKRKTNQLEV